MAFLEERFPPWNGVEEEDGVTGGRIIIGEDVKPDKVFESGDLPPSFAR